MTPITGPNGVVVNVPDDVAESLIGDGSRGYSAAPEPKAQTDDKPKPAPKKRAPRKPSE